MTNTNKDEANELDQWYDEAMTVEVWPTSVLDRKPDNEPDDDDED